MDNELKLEEPVFLRFSLTEYVRQATDSPQPTVHYVESKKIKRQGGEKSVVYTLSGFEEAEDEFGRAELIKVEDAVPYVEDIIETTKSDLENKIDQFIDAARDRMILLAQNIGKLDKEPTKHGGES